MVLKKHLNLLVGTLLLLFILGETFTSITLAAPGATATKNVRQSALVSRSRSSRQSPPPPRFLTWKDYQQMSPVKRMALVSTLQGVFRDIETNNKKKPGGTTRVQKFLSEWSTADATVFKDNKRLITFDANVMVANHFCNKHPTTSCTNLHKISKETIALKK